jgi:hypothetical protein
MHRLVRLAVLFLAVAALLTASSPAPAGKGKSDSVVKAMAKVESKMGNRTVVLVHLDINKGWHLYANPVGHDDLASSQVVVTLKDIGAKPEAVKVAYPAGHVKQDPILGKYHVYEGQVEIRAVVDRAPGAAGPLEVNVKLAACDKNQCLPPAVVHFTLP